MKGETRAQEIARLSRARAPQPVLTASRIAEACGVVAEQDRPKKAPCSKCGATVRGHDCDGYPPRTGLVTIPKKTASRIVKS